jgi:lysophospholipase L1-like esterase
MDRSHKLGFQSANKLNNVFLYYGRGKTELFPDVMVGDSNSLQLSGKDLLNRIQLNTNNSKSIDLAFNFPEPFPIYGLSFESDYGIIVDNLAKRSDSGSNFGRISKEMLASFNKYMEYDLIVLHFGANVLSNEQLNYNHYEQILISTVRHFKESMGDIPVLIVGTTDRVAKIEGSEWTSPAVYPLSNAQRRAAAISQSPFLDLFTKMGGEGSMVKWVKSNPPLAAPDYVHLSGKGSKEIAGYVFDYLANAYEKFSGQSIKNNSSSKK